MRKQRFVMMHGESQQSLLIPKSSIFQHKIMFKENQKESKESLPSSLLSFLPFFPLLLLSHAFECQACARTFWKQGIFLAIQGRWQRTCSHTGGVFRSRQASSWSSDLIEETMGWIMVDRTWNLESDKHEFKFWPCHYLALWSWTSHVTPLSPSVFSSVRQIYIIIHHLIGLPWLWAK